MAAGGFLEFTEHLHVYVVLLTVVFFRTVDF